MKGYAVDNRVVNTIVMRPCLQEDEQAVARLINTNFPNTRSEDETLKTWRWQFRHPFTSGSWVCVASEQSELIAHYAVMKMPMVHMGKEIIGGISTATVTDKRFRGRGLFTVTAQKVYERSSTAECAIIFGFPNGQSMPGFSRNLEWFEIGALPVHLCILHSRPFLQKLFKSSLIVNGLSGITDALHSSYAHIAGCKSNPVIKLINSNSFDHAMSELWRQTFVSERICVARTEKYYRWRYCDKPSASYTFVNARDQDCRGVGFCVFSIAENFGIRFMYILDFLAEENRPDIVSPLLKEVYKIAKERHVDAVSVLLVPGHPLKRCFISHGYFPVPRRLFPQEIYFAARTNTSNISKSSLLKMSNWYISWGDEDVL
jgi:hypothetical protein